MKVLKIIGIIILSVIALIVIIPLFLSSDVTVSRSIEVNAPKDSVYAYLSNFNNFSSWSPWAKIEPNKLKYKVEGSGVGSTYSWEGEKTGKGKMTISELEPNSIKVKMEFLAPWESQADVQWIVEPAGNNTKVTWNYTQKDLKYFQRYFNLTADKFLGGAFNEGLTAVKGQIEKK